MRNLSITFILKDETNNVEISNQKALFQTEQEDYEAEFWHKMTFALNNIITGERVKYEQKTSYKK